MRTGYKFANELFKLNLKNIKRLEAKFNPFHPNAAAIREFYFGVSTKKISKTNVECILKATVVTDKSDPLVTVQFQDNHKLVINCKYLESPHIPKLIRQFEIGHQDETDI